ncbi:MAG: hypothetical protein QG570_640 [Patescibacteria group bacterium]|nr:hypothetical protein [Patescibacteria group bacterium]
MKSSKTSALLVVILILLLGAFLVYYSPKPIQIVERHVTDSGVVIDDNKEELSESIIWKMPVVENSEPWNSVVSGYEDKVLVVGSEFILNGQNMPDDLGNTMHNEFSSYKLKLLEINEESVMVEVLEMSGTDGTFAPPYNPETFEISNNTCKMAMPLVLDAYWEYCFTIEKEEGRMAIKYNIVGHSTLPGR